MKISGIERVILGPAHGCNIVRLRVTATLAARPLIGDADCQVACRTCWVVS